MKNMTKTTPKLIEAQKALVELWINGDCRRQFLQSTTDDYADYGDLSNLSKSGVTLYARLLRENTENLLDSIFPVCRQLVSEQLWSEIIEGYLRQCPPESFHLNAAAQNFPGFLQAYDNGRLSTSFPFFSELADFEWIELAIEEEPIRVPIGDCTPLTSQLAITSLTPTVNPVHALRSYNFSVPNLAEAIISGRSDDLVEFESKISLVFFRDPHTHLCRTLELGGAAERMLCAAKDNQKTYAELVQVAVAASQPAELEESVNSALIVLEKFHEAGLFVGNSKQRCQ